MAIGLIFCHLRAVTDRMCDVQNTHQKLQLFVRGTYRPVFPVSSLLTMLFPCATTLQHTDHKQPRFLLKLAGLFFADLTGNFRPAELQNEFETIVLPRWL